jgi:hypothetical protein
MSDEDVRFARSADLELAKGTVAFARINSRKSPQYVVSHLRHVERVEELDVLGLLGLANDLTHDTRTALDFS